MPPSADRTVGTVISGYCFTSEHEVCAGTVRVTHGATLGVVPCQCECHHAPRREVGPDTLRDATLAHIDIAKDLLRQAADQIQFARQDTARHQATLGAVADMVLDHIDTLEDVAGRL